MKYNTNFYSWCEFHYFNMYFILFYNIQVHLDMSENSGSGKITSDLSALDKKDMSQIKCTICFSQFSSISEMEIHTEVCKKTLLCNKCNKNFENVELMEKHIDVCSHMSKHKCSVCGKCFDDDISHVNHEEKCVGKLVCKNCEKKFAHWKLLLEHFHKAHGNLFCNVCQKLFHIRSEILEHNCVQ